MSLILPTAPVPEKKPAKRKRAKGVSEWMDWYYRNREARNAYNRQQMRDRRAGIKGAR